MEELLVEMRGVGYSAPGGRRLARGLDLLLRAGQVLIVSGPNGCGKSTLLKILLGRAPVDEGTLTVTVPNERRAYIPQLENTDVHLPFTLRDVLDVSVKKLDRTEIETIGLLSSAQLDAAWNTASGGERKRTLLTRALLRHPDLLFFDEPMNHLDATSRRGVIRALGKFLKHPGRGAVLVCHKGLNDDEKSLFDAVYLNFEGAAA